MERNSRENAVRNILPHIDPFAKDEDIEEVTWVNDNEVYFRFKDGRKYMYDVPMHGFRGFYPEGHELTDDEWKLSFKTRLYKLMFHRRINQEELAERVGTSQTMISHYITGRSVPGVIMLAKLARALGCSVEDLLYKEY